MKNQDNSFSVLAAIILAGVILACVPTASSSVVLTPETSTTSSVAAVIAAPKLDVVGVKATAGKSGTCSNERRSDRKADAKLAHRAKSPAV